MLVSLGLILNGSGLAFAGMHGDVGHAVAAAMAMQAQHRATAGTAASHHVPGMHGAGSAHGAHGLTASPAVHEAASATTHAGPDCCKSGGARCASGHGVLVTAAASLPELPLVRAPNLWSPTPGYVSPTPLRLIRPPIG